MTALIVAFQIAAGTPTLAAMPYRFIMLAGLVLTGCSAENDPVDARKARQLQRQEASEAMLSKTPEARTYRYDGNELKVIEVPVRDGSGFVDVQRCFVWRDAEFRSAALSCGQQPDILLAN